jgi:hypothetical protein
MKSQDKKASVAERVLESCQAPTSKAWDLRHLTTGSSAAGFGGLDSLWPKHL